MRRHHRRLLLAAGLLLALGLLACNRDDAGGGFHVDHWYGNGFKDTSPVAARVGDITITERDIELRYKELPSHLKKRFSGPDWKRLLLHYMVQEALLAQEAMRQAIYNDPEVRQQIISQRRAALIDGYKTRVLYKDVTPPENDVVAYYKAHKDELVTPVYVKVRHIQCASREKAEEAYRALQGEGREAKFPYVVAKYSENKETAKRAGDLGWVAKGQVIDGIPYYARFANTVVDWDVGVHEPVKIGPDWHVIEILARRPSRPQTLEEARPRIVQLLKPQLQRQKLEEALQQLREQYPVKLEGEYAPGKGVDDKALLKRALMTRDPEKQTALLDMIVEDYPGTKSAAMALFMKANVILEHSGDRYRAREYLRRLLREYPDTDLREQAEFMLQNMDKIDFKAPTSMEELRALAK